MNTWDELAGLREKGQRPALPVFLTTRKNLSWNIGREFFVIHVPRGTKFLCELLAGLRVILMLDDCKQAAKVIALLKAKSIECEEVRVWCECQKTLKNGADNCEQVKEFGW